jgi:Archaea-specific RecJ-like exonuclease, contains DnaJ-type Zn finger domain
MKRCPQCLGKGEELCPVCQGTRKDPRNRESSCSYCSANGYVKCNVCMGTGKLDDNDDYRRT